MIIWATVEWVDNVNNHCGCERCIFFDGFIVYCRPRRIWCAKEDNAEFMFDSEYPRVLFLLYLIHKQDVSRSICIMRSSVNMAPKISVFLHFYIILIRPSWNLLHLLLPHCTSYCIFFGQWLRRPNHVGSQQWRCDNVVGDLFQVQNKDHEDAM